MARPGPAVPSPKLQQILREFQQIAGMAGFLNHSFDLPQLRLFFTLYGRISAPDEPTAQAALPGLQGWCERLGARLREDSSSAVLPPQVTFSAPQPLPSGEGWQVVATLTFASKVTETSYQRVRTAALSAYQAAIALRETGVAGL